MRPYRSPLGCVLACWLGLATGSVRAGDIYWTYDWTGPKEILNNNGGGVKFLYVANAEKNGVQGLPSVYLQSFGPSGIISNGKYTLTMHVFDKQFQQWANLSFSGVLQGPTNHALLNNFTPPVVQMASIDGHNYAVVIGLFTAPGATGTTKGQIGANVIVTSSLLPKPASGLPAPGQPAPSVTTVPEPSAWVLGCLGLATLGLSYGWRWRGLRFAHVCET